MIKNLINSIDLLLGMPQSFHYNDQALAFHDAKNWMAKIAKQGTQEHLKSKVILTWRQEDSWHNAQTLYPLVDNRLVPDVAFMIGPIQDSDGWTSSAKVDYLFLLRSDHESVHNGKRSREVIDSILLNIKDQDKSYEIVDWWDHGKFHNDTLNILPSPQLKYQVNSF